MLKLNDSWVWDFWTIEHEGSYHLFFLYASRALHDPNRRHRRASVGHAVSTDLVTWTRLADALVHGSPPSFDQTATWTGSVVRGDDGRWYMYYTGTTLTDEGGLLQQAGLAISQDLEHWEKIPEAVTRADARWYETLGGTWRDEHWRDPWVLRDPDGNGWHMLMTARATEGEPQERGVIGHATSSDMLNWQVQPPLTEPGQGFGQLEVIQVAEIEGRHVVVFNCGRGELGEGPISRFGRGGIWAAPAASPLGPYDIAGAYPLGSESLYVGKVLQAPDGQWVMLAFVDRTEDGSFGGWIIDPLPIGWVGEGLRVLTD